MSGALMAASCGLAAAFAILIILRDARAFGLVSHQPPRFGRLTAIPTGGGLALVLGGTVAGGFAAAHMPWPATLLTAAAAAAGGVGLLADLGRIAPTPRLFAEVALVAAAICFGLPFEALPSVLGLPLPVPLLASLVVLAGVLWIGLVSAMDGVEGLAVTGALFLLTAAVGLAVSTGQGILADPNLWWLLGLSAALLVLLGYTWPPARVLLGDSGRLYAGFSLFVLALITVFAQWLTVWEWLVLAAAFVSDGMTALIRRAAAGMGGVVARPAYAYAVLANRLGSQRATVLAFLAIDLFWLYPLALYVHRHPDWGGWTTLIAYAPLLALAFLAGLGRQRHDQLG